MPAEVWTAGWDQSHYDAPMQQRDGIDVVTHKITEGDHFYLDSEYQAGITRAHVLGVSVLGSYHVQHGLRSIANQADWWFAQVDLLSPWWRTHPCWTWQIDAEKFSYMIAPTIGEINALADAICARAKCPVERVIAYAPEWLYGAKLAGLRYRQWESSYVSGSGPYRTLYPGNTSVRWQTAAPGGPLFLQYTSSAVIAGQTTCDANGYRGALVQLLRDLKAGTQGDDMVMRFSFDGTVPGRPPEVLDRIHVTDGPRYRLMPADGTGTLVGHTDPKWHPLLTSAGAGPVVTVSGADLPTGADYNDAVAALCGTFDPGELAGPGSGISAADAAGIADARIAASTLQPPQ